MAQSAEALRRLSQPSFSPMLAPPSGHKHSADDAFLPANWYGYKLMLRIRKHIERKPRSIQAEGTGKARRYRLGDVRQLLPADVEAQERTHLAAPAPPSPRRRAQPRPPPPRCAHETEQAHGRPGSNTELVQSRDARGCTDDEGEALLGILSQSCTPRRGELVARDLVVPTARARLTRQGCKAIV